VTSTELKFVRKTAEYTWQDYKTAEYTWQDYKTAEYTWQDYKRNEDILPEIKIEPLVKKIQNCRKKWVQHIRRMDRDRQTD